MRCAIVYQLLQLLDGGTGDSAVIGKYCGTTAPDPVTTSSNQLRVEFHTDEYLAFPGFLLSWQAVSSSMVGPIPPTNVPGKEDIYC